MGLATRNYLQYTQDSREFYAFDSNFKFNKIVGQRFACLIRESEKIVPEALENVLQQSHGHCGRPAPVDDPQDPQDLHRERRPHRLAPHAELLACRSSRGGGGAPPAAV
jgi:hypothetical protein